jgi:hypothetical protein
MDDLEKSKNLIEKLWNIIDDIDTASDMFKHNNQTYRNYVERKIQERFTTGIKTDGYCLLIPINLRYSIKNISSKDCFTETIRIWDHSKNDFHDDKEYSKKNAIQLVDELNFAWQKEVNKANACADLEEGCSVTAGRADI